MLIGSDIEVIKYLLQLNLYYINLLKQLSNYKQFVKDISMADINKINLQLLLED